MEGVETKNRDYMKDEFKLASLEVFKFKIRMINSLEIGVNIDIKWDMNHPSYCTHCLVAVAVFSSIALKPENRSKIQVVILSKLDNLSVLAFKRCI